MLRRLGLVGNTGKTAVARALVGRGLASNTSPTDKSDGLPLSGVRVLELGQLIAGPFAGQLLGCVRTLLSSLHLHRWRNGKLFFWVG